MNLKQRMREIIYKALNDLGIKFNLYDVMVEVPKSRKNGDFSSNIAMQLTKVLKDNPRNIAEKIVDKIKDNTKEIDKVEIAGPGFINIYLKDEYVFSGIDNVLKANKDYGKLNIGNK